MQNRFIAVSVTIILCIVIDLYVGQIVKTLLKSSSQKAQVIAVLSYVLTSLLAVGCFLAFAYSSDAKMGTLTRYFLLNFFLLFYLPKVGGILTLLIDDFFRALRWGLVKTMPNSEALVGLPITRSTFLAWIGAGLTLIPFSGLVYGLVFGAHLYKVRKQKVFIPHLPDGFEGFKIVQFSDMHSGSLWNTKAIERAFELINSQGGDIIVFTGDLVNNIADEAKRFTYLYKKLKAPMGVYSVLGNHDYGDYYAWIDLQTKEANLRTLVQLQKDCGWDLLLDENRILERGGDRIALIGIQNWGTGRFPKYGDLAKARTGISNDVPVKVLLSHDPSHWDAQVRKEHQDIDLMLSGHTHGMQFGVEIGNFKWSPVQYRYKQWAGLYTKDNQHIYVNRGFGYIGYMGRCGIQPEITVLELTNKVS